jgi:hypothetical protein
MISRIHSKLGTAGLVVAIVALVAALGGGAYAAQQGLNGKQKKEVKKIAKKFAGKNGAPGATGPQGPKGDTGAAGKDGTNGTNGTNGAPGQSVTGTPINTGGACGSQTGVKYTLGATSTDVCNGATGFTETLPSGKTETGVWSLGPKSETEVLPLSFSIPLDEAPEALHFVNEEGEEETGESGVGVTPVNCLGSAEEPKALPGQVCVYEAGNFGEAVGFNGNEELTQLFTSGATLFYQIAENQVAFGTFAVTAK